MAPGLFNSRAHDTMWPNIITMQIISAFLITLLEIKENLISLDQGIMEKKKNEGPAVLV